MGEALYVAGWAIGVVLSLSCGGGGGGDGGTNPPPLTCDQNPNGPGCPTTGSIQVTVSGVPGDVSAPQIELLRSDGSQQAIQTGSGTFTNLPPATYRVVARPTSNSPLVRHSANPGQVDVTVVRGQTAAASFNYSAQTFGAIEFTVQGTPGGATATFTFQGPSRSGSQELREGVNTVPHLEAGAWTISLPNVGSFVPLSKTLQATVVVGAIARPAAVAYSATGTLEVVVAGLPGGAVAQGTITGPNGFSQPISAGLFAGLVIGPYTATPLGVTAGGSTYAANSQTVNVTATAVARLTVTYAPANPVLTIAGGGSGTGSGRVVSTPGGIDCVITDGTAGAGCSAAFAMNTVVQLSATQGTLTSWGGDCAGLTCQVTMSQSRRVVANFAAPPIIVIRTSKPVVIADRVQVTISGNYAILNGGGGSFTPTLTVPSQPFWLKKFRIVASPSYQLEYEIDASTLKPYSESLTPYSVTATISSPGAPDVPVTLKFVKTFDQPAGMAATVVRFHRNSGALTTLTPPPNINALVDLVDARTNAPTPAEILEVAPAGQNWLLPPTINANGQLDLKVIPFTAPQFPLGLLPAPPGNPLGSPIQIRLKKAGSGATCPAFAVTPDPQCQVFVYYTADPYPKIMLRPWGLQFTPAKVADSAAIEVQPGGAGTTLGTRLYGGNIGCGNKLAQPPSVTNTRVSVKVDFSTLQENELFRCKVQLTADYFDSQGLKIGTDVADLELTMTKPGADAITPSVRDLNFFANVGAAQSQEVITLVNQGANTISLGSAALVNSACPAGLLAQPILSGTPLGRGTAQTVTVAINPAGQAPTFCSATLRLTSGTAGVATENIPVTVRIR